MSLDYTRIQTYKRTSAPLSQNLPGSYADDYAKLAETINVEYENSFSQGKFNLSDVGVYNQPIDKHQDAFTKDLFKAALLVNKIDTKNLLQDAITNPGVANMLKGMPTGLKVEYIAPDNGDQVRKFGKLIAETATDSGFRMAITKYALDMYKQAPGNSAKTSIEFAGNYNNSTLLYVPKSQVTPILAGACSTRGSVGSNAYAYRNAYIIKRGDFAPGSINKYEHVWVTAVLSGVTNPGTNVQDANGGVTLVLKRGTGRVRNEDPATQTATPFTQFTPLNLVPGDILVFGQMTPTTECLPEISCTKASPKVYAYCSYSQKYIGCVYTDRQSAAMVQTRDGLTNAQAVAYQISQNLRDSLHQMSHDILFSLPNYAAGQPRPIDIVGSNPAAVEYNSCDVIPYSNRGLIPTIDLFGAKIEHYFTSLNDTCGQYKLGRELEIVSESIGGMTNNGMWKFYGDANPLISFAASQGAYNNVVPNTLVEAQRMQNMQGASFSPNANSIFGANFKAINDNTLEKIQFGDKEISLTHDSDMAIEFPGTMWLTNMDAFQFFAPDRETITKDRLGFNPYFNSTGTRGQLSPLIYSQDMVPTMMNGVMEMKAKNNCGLNFNSYMEYGIHIKAPYLPQLAQLKIGSRLLNSSFDPNVAESVNNPRFIYGSLDVIPGGCGTARVAIEDSLRYWYQPGAVA